ncbi:MAG: pLS20_p028 family conjugation system transmembrane protein [Anaerovoracaceae bacterium]
MSNLKIMEYYSEYFNPQTVSGNAVREIFWGIIKSLSMLINMVSGSLGTVYGMIGLTADSKFSGLVDKIMPIVFLILLLFLVALGYILIIKKMKDTSLIFQNIIIVFLVLTCLPLFMINMQKLSLAGTRYVNASYDMNKMKEQIATQIISSGITDLLYLDGKGFPKMSKLSGNRNAIASKNLLKIDVNEVVEPNEEEIKNKEIFENYIRFDKSGNPKLAEIKDGDLTLLPQYYYRYHIDWLPIIFSILSLCIVIIFTLYKVGKIIFELLYHQIMAYGIAVSDIRRGERLREVLKSIISLFALFFFTSVLLKVFFLVYEFCNIKYQAGEINILVFSLLLLITAIAVTQAPKFMERILGVNTEKTWKKG